MNIKDITQLKLIAGAVATDDRGSLSFVNNLFLDGLKRFYIIENHDLHFTRAWHGHKNEWKVFIPLVGSWIVACHAFDISPANTVVEKAEEGKRFVLSEKNPSALVVPGGYMNGTMNLTQGAKILVMSSSTLEESKNDDYRVPYLSSSFNWQSSFNIQLR